VGARVGGLGQMPGWWFTVESTTTAHLMHQFKSAIEDALAAKTDVRAMMRARSAKQRFPVQKWVEDLNTLQSTAIRIHQREANYGLQPARRSVSNFGNDSSISLAPSRDASPSTGSVYITQPHTSTSSSGLNRTLSLGSRAGPGHHGRTPRVQITDADISEDDEDPFGSEYSPDMEEQTITREEADTFTRESERADALERLEGRGRGMSLNAPQPALMSGHRSRSPSPDPRELQRGRNRHRDSEPYLSVQTGAETNRRVSADSLLPAAAEGRDRSSSRLSNSSRLSTSSQLDLTTVIGGKKDYSLQKIELDFDDKTGEYYRTFEAMLDKLNGKTSEKDLCIEEYLVESEKAWFKKYRDAKLGRSRERGSTANLRENRMSAASRVSRESSTDAEGRMSVGEGSMEDFLLGANYQRPSLVKRWMLTRLGDWPMYSFLLALGQIMAANSYQITLLTGGEDPKPSMIYTIGGIYIVASVIWWLLFRTMKARFVLSVPFVMYGIAFLFIGMAPFLPKGAGRNWMRNVADGVYAAASASGSLYFALNFGDEGKQSTPRPHISFLLTSNRWITNLVLGVPSMHHPRYATALHHRIVLLGTHNHASHTQTED
jgi:alpha-1,3-glucan synthase